MQNINLSLLLTLARDQNIAVPLWQNFVLFSNNITPGDFAIGAPMTIAFEIRNTDPNFSFLNCEIIYTPHFFSDNALPPTNLWGYRGATLGTLGTAELNLYADGFSAVNRNEEVRFEPLGPNTAFITHNFYVTADMLTPGPVAGVNKNRFLGAAFPNSVFQYMTEAPNTAFDTSRYANFSIRFRSPGETTWNFATVGNGPGKVLSIPARAKWYMRDEESEGFTLRPNIFRVRTLSNEVLFTSAYLGGYVENYDQNFGYFTENLITPLPGPGVLSVFERNTLSISIFDHIGANITKWGWLFLRESNLQNVGVPFWEDYGLLVRTGIDNTLPAGTVLDGNLIHEHRLAGVTYKVSIDPDGLQFGQTYRAILMMYDEAAQKAYSAITPPMVANALPNCAPGVNTFLGNYCNEEEAGAALVSFHERITSRIEVNGAQWEFCMESNYGLDLNFEAALTNVQFQVANDVSNNWESVSYSTVAAWNFNNPDYSAISGGGHLMAGFDGNLHNLAAWFRISEILPVTNSPYSGNFLPIRWLLRLEFQYEGRTIQQTIEIRQRVGWGAFEGEGTSDEIDIIFYNAEGYPAEKKKVTSLCGLDKIIAEVVRPNGLPGAVTANIYPELGPGYGQTFLSSIQEENGTDPGEGSILAPSESDIIENVTAESFCIDVTKLAVGQRYFVDALICSGVVPECCPTWTVEIPYWIRRRVTGGGGRVWFYSPYIEDYLESQFGILGVVPQVFEIENLTLGGQTDITYSIGPNDHSIYAVINQQGGTNQIRVNFQAAAFYTCPIDNTTHNLFIQINEIIDLPSLNQPWTAYNYNNSEILCNDISAD